MKKSILIFGKQGSGKSEKLNSLSKCPEFKDSIVIDELSSISQLKSIVSRINSDDEHFLIVCDIPKETISKSILSKFEVIELYHSSLTCR